MKTIQTLLSITCGVAMLTLMGCSQPTSQPPKSEPSNTQVEQHAHTTAGQAVNKSLSITHARVNPSIPGQKVSSAYFTIENVGQHDLKLTGIRSDATDLTEFHTMSMNNNKMVMRKLDSITIPAGSTKVLSSGGDHVMIMNLQKSLSEGSDVTFTFELDNGETMTLTAPVTDMSQLHDHADSHENHDSHNHMHDEHAHDHSEHAHH